MVKQFHIHLQPQTLLLTANNILKDVEEVEEVNQDLIDSFKLQVNKYQTPEKKKHSAANGGTNGHANGHKLFLSPEEEGGSQRFRLEKWKIIASTDMAGT